MTEPRSWDTLGATEPGAFERLHAGIGEPERLWLIDPATNPTPPAPPPSGPVRSHCGHEVAFAALTGVYARLVRDGDQAAAHRAVRLRGRLPVTRNES